MEERRRRLQQLGAAYTLSATLESPAFGAVVLDAIVAVLKEDDCHLDECPCEFVAMLLAGFPTSCPGRTLIINWLVERADWTTLLDSGNFEARIRDYAFLVEFLRAMATVADASLVRAFMTRFPGEGLRLRVLEERGCFEELKTVDDVHKLIREFLNFATTYVAPRSEKPRWKAGLVVQPEYGVVFGPETRPRPEDEDPVYWYTWIGG